MTSIQALRFSAEAICLATDEIISERLREDYSPTLALICYHPEQPKTVQWLWSCYMKAHSHVLPRPTLAVYTGHFGDTLTAEILVHMVKDRETFFQLAKRKSKDHGRVSVMYLTLDEAIYQEEINQITTCHLVCDLTAPYSRLILDFIHETLKDHIVSPYWEPTTKPALFGCLPTISGGIFLRTLHHERELREKQKRAEASHD